MSAFLVECVEHFSGGFGITEGDRSHAVPRHHSAHRRYVVNGVAARSGVVVRSISGGDQQQSTSRGNRNDYLQLAIDRDVVPAPSHGLLAPASSSATSFVIAISFELILM